MLVDQNIVKKPNCAVRCKTSYKSWFANLSEIDDSIFSQADSYGTTSETDIWISAGDILGKFNRHKVKVDIDELKIQVVFLFFKKIFAI